MGFYKLDCGCVKYTNRDTGAVKNRFELSGCWCVVNCIKHKYNELSGYEEHLAREWREKNEKIQSK